MKITVIFLIALIMIILLPRCYFDSEESLFPDTSVTCDTFNVTYSGSVRPILQNNCLECHANNVSVALGGSVRLEEYADVKVRADDGKLVGVISHAPGFVPMPDGLPKLDDCSIAIVRKWVEDGAPNN